MSPRFSLIAKYLQQIKASRNDDVFYNHRSVRSDSRQQCWSEVFATASAIVIQEIIKLNNFKHTAYVKQNLN